MKTISSLWQQKRTRIFVIIILFVLLLILLFLHFSSTKKPQQRQSQVTPPSPSQIHLIPSSSTAPASVAGEVLVKFKPNLSQLEITAALQKYHASIKRTIPQIGTTVLSVPKGQEDAVMQGLRRDGLVQYSEPNYIQRIQFAPNDTYFTNQWYLANTGQTIGAQKGAVNDDVHAEAAWNVSKGTGVKVAILDTGIDLNHPDLAGKVVAQKVFVTNAIEDMFGHGTHVAGIIAADTNNAQGIAGVCPDCQLLIAKAMDDNGIGDGATMATAITWAADNGAKVINMSEGGAQDSQTQDAAINYAWNKGAVIIAAAGNNNSNQLFYPAASANVVSVAATDNINARAYFSNYGSWVNVAAPGQAIFSTLPTHVFAMQQDEPLKTNYDYLSGTSMAAPIVSGIAALIWASPYGTSNTAVVQRLLSTADKIAGTGQYWSDGFVDAAKAVGASTTTPTVTPTPSQGTTPSVATTTPIISPSFGCLGACPTLPTTPTPTYTLPVSPLSQQPVSSGTTTPISPIPSISETNPCTATENQSVAAVPKGQPVRLSKNMKSGDHDNDDKKKHTRHKGTQNRNGLLADLLHLLQQLLKLIEQLLGGNQPSQPTPTPCPSPLPTTPVSPLPSGTLPSASPAVSGVPTISLTPSVSLLPTPSTTPSALPTVSLLPTATTLPSPLPSHQLSATPLPSVTQPVTPSPTLFGTPLPSISFVPSSGVSQLPTATPPSQNQLKSLIRVILQLLEQILKLFQNLFRRH